jgi:hypothetical protein
MSARTVIEIQAVDARPPRPYGRRAEEQQLGWSVCIASLASPR